MAPINSHWPFKHLARLSLTMIVVGAPLLLSTKVPAQAPLKSQPVEQSVISIGEPQDNVEVEKEIDVRGTARIANGDHLWVLIHRTKGFSNVWWPQGEVKIDPQTGQWSVHVILGSDVDAGYDFDIVAITVSGMENLRLLEYHKDAILRADWPPIKMPFPTSQPVYRKVRRTRNPFEASGGKVVSLPEPAYPDYARKAGASGMVTVQVTVDELGKVVSARAVRGDPLLYEAAVAASRRARFQPITVSGPSAKPSGVIRYITYNFAPYGNSNKTTDPFMQAEQLRAQGTAKSLRGAIEKYEEALMLWGAKGNYYEERGAATLNIIGQIYRSLGEPQAALDYYNRALSIWHTLDNTAGETGTLNNIGVVYYSLGDYQRALDYYNKALLIGRGKGNREEEAGALNNIGLIYDSLGDYQKALGYFDQVLPIWRALRNSSGEATTLNNIGIVYASRDERQKALDYFNQALLARRKTGDRRGEATTLGNIGAVYESSRDYQEALEYYDKSLSQSRVAGDRGNEAAILYRIAHLERDRGNLSEALTRIEATIAIIESLRTKIASQELRLSFSATMHDYYESYIDVSMRLHNQFPAKSYDAAALQASEQARARSLLETLNEANAEIRQSVDPNLVERERSLQQQLNARAQFQMKILAGSHSEEQASTVAKEIDALTTGLQQVETQIRQTSPHYAALTQPQPLRLKEIQTQVLDADTLLLEYSLGKDRSYLWAVTPDSMTSYELPNRDEIEQVARQVYDLLTNPNQWDAEAQRELSLGPSQQTKTISSPEAATRLSEMILAPVAEQLGEKRLLVVGDGALQYIPFGALPIPHGSGSTNTYRPLIAEHEIVSLPSASTLAVLRGEVRDRNPAPKTFAVLADPVFERTDERITRSMKKAPRNTNEISFSASENRGLGLEIMKSARESSVARAALRIPRLPGTRQEAEQILALVPPMERKQAFDFDANRATATSPDLSQYRYVHFATHGFLNSQTPELSGIVLSMFDENGQPQDGFLRAHEIFNLKIPAELVVLSACQTGLGKEVKGEGLVGLTRGFMYAGAPRLVVSLWNVSDVGTAELMTRFYRGILKEGLRPAHALQAAQLSMLKEKRFTSPFYWAAFTLQGEWR
jgi:TonB family protein